MQPVRYGAMSSTLPLMPAVGAGKKTPKPEKRRPTRLESVRAAKAKISRRKSLQKQRDGQKAKQR
jgi:hypothetical protein